MSVLNETKDLHSRRQAQIAPFAFFGGLYLYPVPPFYTSLSCAERHFLRHRWRNQRGVSAAQQVIYRRTEIIRNLSGGMGFASLPSL